MTQELAAKLDALLRKFKDDLMELGLDFRVTYKISKDWITIVIEKQE